MEIDVMFGGVVAKAAGDVSVGVVAEAVGDVSGGGGVPLEVLERRLTSWASHVAAAEAQWLGWLAEYDARQGWAEWGCVSASHWLSWKCGMTPGAACERVRVAAALVELPLIWEAALEGRLSYSKLRALTRVANRFNEADLADMAIEASGAQLERICRGYRASAPGAEETAAAFWQRGLVGRRNFDGTTTFNLRVLDDAVPQMNKAVQQIVDGMLDDAVGQGCDNGSEDAEAGRSRRAVIEERGGIAALRCDAVVALLTGVAALAVAPVADLTFVGGQEHHRNAHQTTRQDIPAETPDIARLAELAGGGVRAETPDIAELDVSADVPAETPDIAELAVGGVPAETPDIAELAVGGVRAETPDIADLIGFDPFAVHLDGHILAKPVAQRLCCDPRITPLLEDAAHNPVGVGRSTRLINRRLRRALERRDAGSCQFPGCHTNRSLHAHHIIHWAHGGETELDNLILVCQFHHHLVHDAGWTVDPTTHKFSKPDTNTPVDHRPDAARSRGNASFLERDLGPAWPTIDELLEPPNYGPFDLPFTTAMLHHNESLRRTQAERANPEMPTFDNARAY